MAGLILKAIGIWFLLVIVAIVNAVLREKWLMPAIGPSAALPASGVLLSLLILLAALVSVPHFDSSDGKTYISVGLIWFMLTLAFELFFGHFVAGKPWHEIMQVFNIRKGDLFMVVLLSTLVSPWLAARLKGLI
ncbi:MAG: hypothetical protein AMJ54_11420 [Deltaproteobacteria bacterium SG8_13]|nr:MAG: hypothetical protein AMJ54_11420 [Deltaproteobacteria bacterium SG8_13]